MVLATAVHDRPIGVEPVEQQEDGKAGKKLLDPFAQSVEGTLLAASTVGGLTTIQQGSCAYLYRQEKYCDKESMLLPAEAGRLEWV